MLREPVRLLDGVADALHAVAQTHRVVMITKGDLVHQTRKVQTSGLHHVFEHIKIVLEKDVSTYRAILNEWGINPSTFLMVGNSVRSDILPVVELGGFGLHIPYHVTWDHEVVDAPKGPSTVLPPSQMWSNGSPPSIRPKPSEPPKSNLRYDGLGPFARRARLDFWSA